MSFDIPLNEMYDGIFVPSLDSITDHTVKCFVQNVYNIFNIYLPLYNIFSPIIFLVLFYVFKRFMPKFFVDKCYLFLKISLMGLTEINIFKINSFFSLIKTIFSLVFYVYNIYSSIKFSCVTNILINQIKKNLTVLKSISGKLIKLYKINSLGCEKLEPLKIRYFRYK